MLKLVSVLLWLLILWYPVGGSGSCDKFSSIQINKNEPLDGVFYKLPSTDANITLFEKGTSKDIFYNSSTKQLYTTQKIYVSTKHASFGCTGDDGVRRPFILTIQIHDVNNKPPNWISGSNPATSIRINIPEGKGAVGSAFPGEKHPAVWCNGNDSPPVTNIRYEILNGLNSDKFRIVSPEKGKNLELKLNTPLDYESVTRINLIVRCTDSDKEGAVVGTADLLVMVVVTNIYELHFKDGINPHEVLDLPESTEPFKPIKTIEVSYSPKSETRKLSFQVRKSEKEFAFQKCNTAATSCDLVLSKSLDYENPRDRKYIVEYSVYDHLTVEIKGTITVNLQNVDDNDPKFSKPEYVFKDVPRKKTSIGRVEATDRDEGSKISYSIKRDGRASKDFVIDENDGKISYTGKSEDIGSQPITLEVTAKSGKKEVTATVKIQFQAKSPGEVNRATRIGMVRFGELVLYLIITSFIIKVCY